MSIEYERLLPEVLFSHRTLSTNIHSRCSGQWEHRVYSRPLRRANTKEAVTPQVISELEKCM